MHFDGLAPAEQLIRVLATWGAEARPELLQLLEALTRDDVAPAADDPEWRRLLESRELLPAELNSEIGKLEAGGPDVGPTASLRRDALIGCAREHLAARAAEIARGLTDDWISWLGLIDPGDFERLLAGLADAAVGPSIPERIASIRRLEKLRGAWEDLRRGRSTWIQERLQRRSISGDVVRSLFDRLSSSDGAARSAARQAMIEALAHDSGAEIEREFSSLRDRVVRLCAEGRETLDRAGNPPEGVALRRAIEQAEAALSQPNDTARDRIEKPRSHERAIRSEVDAFREGDARKRAARETLFRRLAADPDAVAGNAEFAARVEELLDRCNAARRGESDAAPAALTRLDALARELWRDACSAGERLPIRRLTEIRRLVTPLLQGSIDTNPQDLAALEARLAAESTAVKRASAETRKPRETRSEAPGRRQRTEAAERVLPLATSAERKRLERSLRALEADDDPGDDAPAVSAVERIVLEIENRIRTKGALLAAAARRSGVDREVGRDLAALRSAMEEDDLETIAALSASQRADTRAGRWLRSPVTWLVLEAALILLIAGLIVGPRWFSAPNLYKLQFFSEGPRERPRAVALYPADGGAPIEKDLETSQTSLDFTLEPGVYLVFVDGHYVGRSLPITEDGDEIPAIPLPP